MKTNTSFTPKVRVLSAFMAFLIFALTLPMNGFEFGVRVNAASGSPKVTMTKSLSYFSASELNSNRGSSDTRYSYTGKIKSVPVNMYDYLSDEEISGSGSWNTGITKSVVDQYNDPYTIFNTNISNTGTLYSSASNNVTIIFKTYRDKFADIKQVEVNFKHKVSENNYNGTLRTLKYDFHANDATYIYYKYTSKLTDITDSLGTIDRVEFKVTYSNGSVYWVNRNDGDYNWWIGDSSHGNNVGSSFTFLGSPFSP